MILHPDGRIEGTPNEVFQFVKLQDEHKSLKFYTTVNVSGGEHNNISGLADKFIKEFEEDLRSKK